MRPARSVPPATMDAPPLYEVLRQQRASLLPATASLAASNSNSSQEADFESASARSGPENLFSLDRFHGFLIRAHSDENLHFVQTANAFIHYKQRYLRTQERRGLPVDRDLLISLWEDSVYLPFIRVNSPMECNLPQDIREMFEENVASHTLPTDDQIVMAVKHIFQLLLDSYRHYTQQVTLQHRAAEPAVSRISSTVEEDSNLKSCVFHKVTTRSSQCTSMKGNQLEDLGTNIDQANLTTFHLELPSNINYANLVDEGIVESPIEQNKRLGYPGQETPALTDPDTGHSSTPESSRKRTPEVSDTDVSRRSPVDKAGPGVDYGQRGRSRDPAHNGWLHRGKKFIQERLQLDKKKKRPTHNL